MRLIRLPAEIAALRPPLEVDGGRIRLALVWTGVAFVATAIGPIVAAVIFAGVALGAAGQACRAWRREARRPYRPVAVVGAVLVALAGAAGSLAVTAAAVVTGVAAAVVGQTRLGGRDWDGVLTAAIALVAGLGGAAIPLARAELGAAAALVLLVTVLAAEASWFVIGTGARRRVEAPIASTAAVIAITIAAAAVLVPPFRGSSPWVLGIIAAVLIPFGPHVASAVLPRVDAVAPALRRLDSYVLAGPVWVLAASALLDLS